MTCKFKGECSGGECCNSNCKKITEGQCSPEKPDDGVFEWKTGDYGACEDACIKTREVYCVDGGALRTDDAKCDASAKPQATQSCETERCESSPPKWVSGKYRACSAGCGGGDQSRKVQCIHDGKVVQESKCSETKPQTTRRCNEEPCKTPKMNISTAAVWTQGDVETVEWIAEEVLDNEPRLFLTLLQFTDKENGNVVGMHAVHVTSKLKGSIKVKVTHDPGDYYQLQLDSAGSDITTSSNFFSIRKATVKSNSNGKEPPSSVSDVALIAFIAALVLFLTVLLVAGFIVMYRKRQKKAAAAANVAGHYPSAYTLDENQNQNQNQYQNQYGAEPMMQVNHINPWTDTRRDSNQWHAHQDRVHYDIHAVKLWAEH